LAGHQAIGGPAVLFFLTFPAVFIVPYWGYFYFGMLGLYLLLIGIEAVRKAEKPGDIFGVAAALVVGNIGPGVGSILGPLGILPELKSIYRNE
jgi:hypothetical protein